VTDYAKWLRDLSVFMEAHALNDENVGQKLLMAAGEIDRLTEREADLKSVLKHALYNEPNGVDLAQRLTSFAINQRQNT
jgi:hypothetical protein